MKKILILLSILFCVMPIANVKAEDVVSATYQLRSASTESFAGIGTSEDPYKIAVAPGAFTAPSAFWGDYTQSNGVATFAVSFEQFKGDATAGKLISSEHFDLSKNATSVWDGTWSYAFRFPSWTMFDTTTGDLRMAFPYKGNFDTYWTDWTYKFDALDQTANLTEDKQIKAGDIVMITNYGNYIESQTSRGTNYFVDFSVSDNNASSASYYAVVDENGYATFNGDNAIEFGGNYLVQKLSLNVEANNGATTIDTKSGTLQLGATVSPTSENQRVKWEIIDGSSLASIDENGLLTAKENGQVKVRVYYDEFTELYCDYTVSISNQSYQLECNDEKTGLTVAGNIPEGYLLVVNPIGSHEESYQNILNYMEKGALNLGCYDIHFEKNGDTMVINEPVTLTFTVGEKYNGYSAVIYHNHNGEISEHSTIVEDGIAVIKVENFSEFLVTISNYTTNVTKDQNDSTPVASDQSTISSNTTNVTKNPNSSNPVTSDQSTINIYIMIMIISIGCLIFIRFSRKVRK